MLDWYCLALLQDGNNSALQYDLQAAASTSQDLSRHLANFVGMIKEKSFDRTSENFSVPTNCFSSFVSFFHESIASDVIYCFCFKIIHVSSSVIVLTIIHCNRNDIIVLLNNLTKLLFHLPLCTTNSSLLTSSLVTHPCNFVVSCFPSTIVTCFDFVISYHSLLAIFPSSQSPHSLQ